MLNPENIHCLALNFLDVGNKDEEPLYFVKSRSSLCYDGSSVTLPGEAKLTWTEVELGIVVKKDCSEVSERHAEEFIEGYVVCADITCKNIFNRDHHLGFSKSRKNFCPINPKLSYINLKTDSSLEMHTIINGNITQSGNILDMKYNVFKSLSYISNIVCLKEKDIILTGTPSGVENNILKKGDRVKHEIERIGELNYEII